MVGSPPSQRSSLSSRSSGALASTSSSSSPAAGQLLEEEEPRLRCHHWAGGILCLLIFFGCGLAVFLYGPQRMLQNILLLIPAKPGSRWFVGMCSLTLVSIVMLLPIWPAMCMASGLVFGVLYGSVLNFFAISGAAFISIIIGRCILQEPVRRLVEQSSYDSVRRMMLVLEDAESSLKFQVLFRFLFIPMFVRNYAPSTLHIPVWKLVLGSLPHSVWISIMFASVGASFKDAAELIRHGKEFDLSMMKWQQILVYAVAITLAVVLAYYAHSKYRERLAEDDAQGLSQSSGRTAKTKVASPSTTNVLQTSSV